MARTYKRDSKGRFSGTGSGGKIGKSAKNESARAKYKAASSKARSMTKTAKAVAANPKSTAKDKAFWNKQAGGAKSGLTRVSNNLSGKGKKKSAKGKKKKSAKGSAGIEAARAAGRKKGKAIAAKVSARNAALDRKAKAYGG